MSRSKLHARFSMRALLLLQLLVLAACSRPPPGDPSSRRPDDCRPEYPTTVVYGVNIRQNIDWRPLLTQQLRELAQSGITRCATVHVSINAPQQATHPADAAGRSDRSTLLAEARTFVWNALKAHVRLPRQHLIIHLAHSNSTLYHSLHRAWQVARAVNAPVDAPPDALTAPHHLVLHLHNFAPITAQLVNAQVNSTTATRATLDTTTTTSSDPTAPPLAVRDPCEQYLFSGTVTPWRRIVDAFDQNPAVTHAGMFPTTRGSIWKSVWWARASYLLSVPEPQQGQAEGHYEDLLGLNAVQLQGSSRTLFTWRGCATCFSLEWPDGGPGVARALEDLQASGCPPRKDNVWPNRGGEGAGVNSEEW